MLRPGLRSVPLLAALLLATLGVWVSPGTAFACDCAGISTARALRQADAVFRGTVVGRDDVGRGREARTDLRFRVDAVYKGTAYTEQVVATPRDAKGCGLAPAQGSTWVVFALEGIEGTGDDAVSRLVTTLCSGNLPDGAAPALLGQPRPPREGRSDREEQATNVDRTLTSWLGGVGIAALAVLWLGGAGLAYLWRPGRPPARTP